MNLRLHFLTTILLAVLSSGCSKPSAAPPLQASKPPEKILRVLCMKNSLQQSVLDQFCKETGIPVEVECFDTRAGILSYIVGCPDSYYDVLQIGNYGIPVLIENSLLHPLDHALLPNLSHVDPQFLNLPFDPANRFTVPERVGWTGLIYNPELTGKKLEHYGDLLCPEWKGRIVVRNSTRGVVRWALESQNLPLDEITPESEALIRPVLKEWMSYIGPSLLAHNPERLGSGDAVAGAIYSGEAAAEIQKNPQLRWVFPKEETRYFMDSLAISNQTTKFDEASKFLNFLMRPDVAKMIADAYPYMSPNLSARKLLSPEQLENPASYLPPEVFAKLSLTPRYDGSKDVQIERLIMEAKEADFPYPDASSPANSAPAKN